MTTTFSLKDSAWDNRDVGGFFTDTDKMFKMTGAAVTKEFDTGGRMYALVSIKAHDDTGIGWDGTATKVIMAEPDGFPSIAPVIGLNPVIKGPTQVGKYLMCIGGRCRGWPYPMHYYQWTRNGVDIVGETRWIYKQVAADVGARIRCRQRWENVNSAVSFTADPGTNTTLAPTLALTGTVRYVIPGAGAGLQNGTSWANAYGEAKLLLAGAEAGPGGTVCIAAERGPYRTTNFNMSTGGTPGNLLTWSGVDSTTGREMQAEFEGGRGDPVDAGTSLTMVGPEGEWVFGLVGPSVNVDTTISGRVDVTANTIVTTAEWWSTMRTGDRMRIGAGCPAPLVADTVTYYVIRDTIPKIRVATTRQNALDGIAVDLTSGGTGTFGINSRGIESAASIDPATDEITVSSEFYAATFTGDVVQSTATVDPTINHARCGQLKTARQYPVTKLPTANKIKLSLISQEHWLANTKGLSQYLIDFTSTGTDLVLTRMVWERGPSFSKYKNLRFNNAGAADAAILYRAATESVQFEDVYGYNVYRLFSVTSTSNSAPIMNCSHLRAHVYICERGLMRNRYASYNTTWTECTSDSLRMARDPFTSQFVDEGSTRQTISTTEATPVTYGENGPTKTVTSWCMVQRSYHVGAPGYWNGDGFENNRYTAGNKFKWCEAFFCSDAGFDTKGLGTEYEDCLTAFNKKGYKMWGNALAQFLTTRCWSGQPEQASAWSSENTNRNHFLHLSNGGTWLHTDPVIIEASGVAAFELFASDTPQLVEVVNAEIIKRPNGTVVTNAGGGRVATFTPPRYNAQPVITSPANVQINSGAALSYPVTANQPIDHIEILSQTVPGTFSIGLSNTLTTPTLAYNGTSDTYSVTYRAWNDENDYRDFTLTLDVLTTASVTNRSGSTLATVSSGNLVMAPQTTIAGELLVACIAYKGTAPFALPAGWTLCATQQTPPDSATAGALMAWRVAGASQLTLTDRTFTRTGGDVAVGSIRRYGGCAASPADGAVADTRATSLTSVIAPTMTTTVAGDLLVSLFSYPRLSGGMSAMDAVTQPSGNSGATTSAQAVPVDAWAERLDAQSSTGSQVSIGVFDAIKATAAATGQFSAGAATNASRGALIVAAFKKA